MQKLSDAVKRKKILVVDDAPSMRSLLCASLKSFGVTHIYEAVDGKDALQKLKNKSIELIFCDWEMPKKDGLELFKDIKADQELENIPFVLITSMAEMSKVKLAIDSGIENYIVKPFKEDTLIAKINELLS